MNNKELIDKLIWLKYLNLRDLKDIIMLKLIEHKNIWKKKS
jgi:hypothetical protein